MAKQLTPLGRALSSLCGLALLGYALYRYGVFGKIGDLVAPAKKAEGTVSRDDFGPGGSHTGLDRHRRRAPRSPAASRLNRPLRVAIVLWGGYAGGIMANGGMAPTRTACSQGLRRRGRAAADRRLREVARRLPRRRRQGRRRHHVVDRRRLRAGVRRAAQLNPKAILQYDWSRGGDAIAVDASIQSVADLRGKKLACAQETPSHYFALYTLTPGRPDQPRRRVGVHRLRRGGGQRLQGRQGRRGGVVVARRLRGRARAQRRPHPGLHQGSQQPDRGHLRGPRRPRGEVPRGRAPLRGRLAEGRGAWCTRTRTRGACCCRRA